MFRKTIFRDGCGNTPGRAVVSTLAMIIAGSAFAQTTDLQEIMVTAQRREERVQDVPIAITTISSTKLEQAAVTNVRDLIDITPGLHMGGAGVNITPTIRGVNSQQTDPGNDANVPIYVDGVYQANQISNNMNLPDISRIEVLKGPQGTLFGRNAAGGAIRIFTQEPSMDVATGQFDFGYGSLNEIVAKEFLSAPLINGKLAASISGSYEKSDGYDRNIVTSGKDGGTEYRSLRVKLLAKPSDATSIEVFGVYTYNQDDNSVAYLALNGNSAARPAPINPLGVPGAIIAQKPYQYASNGTPTLNGQVYTAGVHGTVDTNIGEFSSLTTYNSTKSFYYTDADASTANIAAYPSYETNDEESEELLFTSKKFDQFQFTSGVYYYGATGRYDPLILAGSSVGGLLYGYMRQRTDAYAGFGELTWESTDRVTFIAGGRYSDERRQAEGGYFLTFGRPPTLPPIGHGSFGSFTPRASVRYRLTDDDNVYFTYSQGFKSGGFDISSLDRAPFKPEKLVAYEIGLKTSPSRSVSANVSAFYYDYTNQQVLEEVSGLNVTTNAAASHIYGADADITARLMPDFTVTTGISVLHARYVSFTNADINVPLGGPSCLCGNVTKTGVNLDGTTPDFSPKFTLSIGADYKKDLAMGKFDLSTYVYYTSSFYFSTDIEQGRYTTLALRASFQPTDSKFSFYAWGRNVTNTHYFYATLSTFAASAASYAAPATYGAGIKYAF